MVKDGKSKIKQNDRFRVVFLRTQNEDTCVFYWWMLEKRQHCGGSSIVTCFQWGQVSEASLLSLPRFAPCGCSLQLSGLDMYISCSTLKANAYMQKHLLFFVLCLQMLNLAVYDHLPQLPCNGFRSWARLLLCFHCRCLHLLDNTKRIFLSRWWPKVLRCVIQWRIQHHHSSGCKNRDRQPKLRGELYRSGKTSHFNISTNATNP